MSTPMPADRERETEQVETAIASLRAAVVDDNTLAEWFRPGYLLEVANLLDRLRGDARTLREDLEHAAGECLVPVPEPGSDMSRVLLANVLMRRERDAAIDRARSTPGGET
jgi:hypothetical protein